MRYGVISDIHGNLEALEAVLGSLDKESIDKYLCLGDIVGYGANPAECIKNVRALDCEMSVAGNHEWGVLGFLDLGYFNEQAAAAIEWTENMITGSDADYLKTFRLSESAGNVTLVHGSLDEPKEFFYIFDANDTDKTFKALKTAICFVGHSHVPGIFLSDGARPVRVKGTESKTEKNIKYVVNVGSVGQPRDGNPKAAYVVYDDEPGTIEIKRVSYDIRTAQKKIISAGLPAELAARLQEGR